MQKLQVIGLMNGSFFYKNFKIIAQPNLKVFLNLLNMTNIKKIKNWISSLMLSFIHLTTL
jgi:hypothetical protein